MQEADMRRIVKAISDLEFKSGRIVQKEHLLLDQPNDFDSELLIGSWNCNGWYLSHNCDDSRTLRENILHALNCDIIGLSETHLKGDDKIDLLGYKWIGSNRRTILHNSWRGSGGVGFLLKSSLLQHFEVDILDINRDDILWIQLRSKVDQDMKMNVCVCY
ncbi:unnamed protein product [Mytilus edulis]|uniref:Endonuclease/exonuclease/phosphatase domain-containing protein n=1 Tax=Mytilus edulis TaxID=6550 RepID=A0A8S3QQZ9_MYTED|nr:unnamed protein product [Mytilus edulis]